MKIKFLKKKTKLTIYGGGRHIRVRALTLTLMWQPPPSGVKV
jgi:hypothetical protein